MNTKERFNLLTEKMNSLSNEIVSLQTEQKLNEQELNKNMEILKGMNLLTLDDAMAKVTELEKEINTIMSEVETIFQERGV